MTAHRDSLPSCPPAPGRSADLTRVALDLGSYTYSQLEGIVVLTASIICIALGAVLWGAL
jgi:hypothetical protein